MNWDYAWLTKNAKAHGGVEQFINDIRNEGYQKGEEQGFVIGAVITTIAIGTFVGVYKGVKHKIEERKAVKARSELAKVALRQAIDEVDSEANDNNC